MRQQNGLSALFQAGSFRFDVDFPLHFSILTASARISWNSNSIQNLLSALLPINILARIIPGFVLFSLFRSTASWSLIGEVILFLAVNHTVRAKRNYFALFSSYKNQNFEVKVQNIKKSVHDTFFTGRFGCSFSLGK